MKDTDRQVAQPPVEPSADSRHEAPAIKRITLALLDEMPSDTGERGFDPYNATNGRTRREIWRRR